MLRHYLAVALRGFARSRLPSAVGVGVLALGGVCFVAAYLFVSHLRSYDRHFANAGRFYVIMQSIEVPASGMSVPLAPGSALPLAEQLKLDVPELEAVARYAFGGQSFVTVDGEASYQRIAYAEPAFLEIFDFATLAGDSSAALDTPRSAIITEHTAERLFGTRDVVGRTVEITALRPVDATIAAVIAEIPAASHLSRTALGSRGFDLLVSWDVFETAVKTIYHDSWGNLPVLTYTLMPADRTLTLEELNRRLVALAANRIPDQFSWGRFAFEARPVSEIGTRFLQTQFQGFYGADWSIDVLDALLVFAGAILAVACLNFVNLATAQSASRARAVGTRKVMGATAGQIVRQDLVRTALLVAAALLLALAALAPAGRLLEGPWRGALEIPWSEPRLWVFLALALPVLALAAGLYPALVLARVRAATALRWGTSPAGSSALRALLVGLQFATASFLLVAVVVLLSQRDALRAALLDRFDDPYVVLNPLAPLEPNGARVDPDVLATELMRAPGIKGVTAVSQYPFQAGPGGGRLRREPSEEAAAVTTTDLRVTHDYFAVMEVPLLAGRVFSRDRADDGMPQSEQEFRARQTPPRIVIDRNAARALGWPDPAAAIGEPIYPQGSSQPLEIVGVVESVPTAVRSSETAGIVYFLHPQFARFTIVRLAKDDVAGALAHLDDTVETLVPGRPAVSRVFLDQAFENAFWTFTVMNRVLTGLALIAIAIAGAGLYAMAGFMTVRRTREIGLRKTQGASSAQILRLLLIDFSKPVLAANLLVWPFAFAAADRYLDLFAERIALTPLPFVVALAGTLAIAWVAVGSHVLRAANVRPTQALRIV